MIILSVLLVALCMRLTHTRRLIEDLDNEISPMPEVNIAFPFPKSEWVKINKPPTQLLSRKVGQHAELQCEAMGSPPPTIYWYKRNLRITENESFKSSVVNFGSQTFASVVSRLVFNYILPRHQDIYRCVAEVNGRADTAVTKLVVIDKEGREMNFTQLVAEKILGAHHLPRVTFWAQTYMDVIGSDVILPCKSVGNPKPTLTWWHPNQNEIENDDRFTILPDGELRIRSITWEDMGVFTCLVKNSVGVDSAESFLYPMEDSK